MNRELLIGTYTETLPHVNGKASGILQSPWRADRYGDAIPAVDAINPSWIAVADDGNWMYAVNEISDFGEGASAASYHSGEEPGPVSGY